MCSIPTSHLVPCFVKGTYKSDGVSSAIDPTSSDVDSDETILSNAGETSQRVHSQSYQQKTSTLKKSTENISSQIIIISSKELLISSDESSTIDLGMEADVPTTAIN